MFAKPNHAQIRSQVDAIMAKNRSLYGGWTMSIAPGEPAPTEPPVEPPVATATPPAPVEPKPTEPPKSDPWDDPTAAKAEIERLRRENAKDRTNAKAQAAEDARKDLAQTISKALGIVEDGAETDPAKLTESLTASQAEAKKARVELAIFRNAAAAGGDPAALLDSSSFLKSLAAIDPADAAAVTEAIKTAVEANPRLGAALGEPRPPAPNPAQGASASGAPVGSLDAQIAEAEKARDFQKAIALKQQRAAELRTQKKP